MDVPKSSSELSKTSVYLLKTRRRISPLFSAERVIAVVTKRHEGFYSRELTCPGRRNGLVSYNPYSGDLAHLRPVPTNPKPVSSISRNRSSCIADLRIRSQLAPARQLLIIFMISEWDCPPRNWSRSPRTPTLFRE
jgi:hypothetical protein